MPWVLGALVFGLIAYGVRSLFRRSGETLDGESVSEDDDTDEMENAVTDVDPAYDFGAIDTYPPNSAEAVALFTAAAESVGLPVEWASSPALHHILRKESGGRVGIPNYTYMPESRDPSYWPVIWEALRAGKYTGHRIESGPEKGKFSSATGLGQLNLPNVRKYYPSGVQGIGIAVEEAAGMLKYIEDRYGSPENAWALYGTRGEGY